MLAYTNISPMTITYNNLNHFIQIKKKSKAKKLIICVWDSFVLDDERFQRIAPEKDRESYLRSNVEYISRFLTHEKIDHRIIYLSEALKRINQNELVDSLFDKILSKITLHDIIDSHSTGNLVAKDFSISKINFVVADYLIATFFKDLFPEFATSNPKSYFCMYTKIFERTINLILKDYIKPKISSVIISPLLFDPKEFVIPSNKHSLAEIKKILASYAKNKKITSEMAANLLDSINNVMDGAFFDVNHKETKLSVALKSLKNLSSEELQTLISINLFEYYRRADNIITNVSSVSAKPSLHVTSSNDFSRFVASLNPLKLTILKHCNGSNTSLDISRMTAIKLSTVSTYMTQLKNIGLITKEKKPSRTTNALVLPLS